MLHNWKMTCWKLWLKSQEIPMISLFRLTHWGWIGHKWRGDISLQVYPVYILVCQKVCEGISIKCYRPMQYNRTIWLWLIYRITTVNVVYHNIFKPNNCFPEFFFYFNSWLKTATGESENQKTSTQRRQQQRKNTMNHWKTTNTQNVQMTLRQWS